jgi:hypothetical protein
MAYIVLQLPVLRHIEVWHVAPSAPVDARVQVLALYILLRCLLVPVLNTV